MGELNVYGVYVPIFLIQAVLAYGVWRVVCLGTDRLIEQDWIALPSIFNLGVYLILLWLIHWLFI
ncbi:DUF1656 domain-containing protein [Acinetobacter sp. Marseille-Q1618]|uniref:DUF1656 domain-containing protein n=1 Tax=Acinetobacter sp. Marseille-Q1618 TaxID=2697502 RepID=UPI00156EE265|nr:DUF1656 domain-containing protein [Acinetobacter sp. Marseille-Q1618]